MTEASSRIDLSREWAPLLGLAVPVVFGHLGMMLMGIVDTVLVGALGSTALGAVGVGNSVVGVGFLAGLGLLLGIDRQVAVANGAGRPEDVARVHVHGVGLALAVSLPLVAILYFASDHLDFMGVSPELIAPAAAWIRVAAWSLIPALLFIALRQSLQAMGDTRAATALLIAANGVNVFFNLGLLHGRYGLPHLGVVGSAWATLAARLFTAVLLLAWSLRRGPDLRGFRWRIHWRTMRDLLSLGGPAMIQLVFEGGVFSMATILCARLGSSAAAAHNVVLQIASFSFMVPLGISAAGSVRVGNAIGRGDLPAAARAGWSAVALGVGVMALSSVSMLLLRAQVIALFDLDAPTGALAGTLMLCAAFFQLFDGAQVTLSGVLRGSGDTVASMVANLVGHWLIGLPVGYTLAFVLGYGATGVWVGLAAGLGAVASGLLLVWRRRIGLVLRGELQVTPASD